MGRILWARRPSPADAEYNDRSLKLIHDLIRESRVLDLGPLPAPRLAPGAAVQQVLQILARGRRGAVVAVDEELVPVGIFTERDVIYRLRGGPKARTEERRKTALRDVMSEPPVTIRRQATLLEAIETMDRLAHRHLVVVDRDGRLRGLLTTNDLIQFLTDQFPEDTVNLPPRLHQRYDSAEGA